MGGEEVAYTMSGIHARVIMHKKLRGLPMRQKTLFKGLGVTLAAIATAESIRIPIHDH